MSSTEVYSFNPSGSNADAYQPLKTSSTVGVDMAVASKPLAEANIHPAAGASASSSPLKVALVVVFYIVTSVMMVMVNKAVLNQTGLPMVFLWGQLVVAVAILRGAALCRLLTLPPLTWPIMRALTPLIVMNVVGLTLNTLCLNYIDALMYQVARSLILPITVAMSPALMGTKISARVLGCCAIIFAGFLVGVFGERTLKVSTLGVVFGVLSSFSTALHTIVIKLAFHAVHHNGAFDMVYYNNVLSIVWLVPMLVWEWSDMRVFYHAQGWAGVQLFIYGTIVAGVSGLLINLSSFLQIKVTSPLTHTVSSAARGVLQTIAAKMLLGELITVPRALGIIVTLAGSCLYSWVKAVESRQSAEKPSEYFKLEHRAMESKS